MLRVIESSSRSMRREGEGERGSVGPLRRLERGEGAGIVRKGRVCMGADPVASAF